MLDQNTSIITNLVSLLEDHSDYAFFKKHDSFVVYLEKNTALKKLVFFESLKIYTNS